MRKVFQVMTAGLFAAVVFAAGSSSGAVAQPGPAVHVPHAGTAAIADQVRYRRHGAYYGNGRYYGGRRHYGRNIGIGIGAAVITGILLSEAARAEHRRSHSSAWERCADTFRSFEPDTGYYTGYDGVRRPCPYLH